MRNTHIAALTAAAILASCKTTPLSETDMLDSLSWLDEVKGERALAWVREQNASTAARLTQSALFQRNYELARAVHLEREPTPLTGPSMIHEGWIFDFTVDAAHPRGLWRRMKLQSLMAGATEWQPLIDVTALAAAEGRPLSMVLPVRCFRHRCLVSMEGASHDGRSGWDLREFDLQTRAFVKDGFNLPTAVATYGIWKDIDSLFLTSDFGPETLCVGGNPMTVREWGRGSPPATELFRGSAVGRHGVIPLEFPATDGARLVTLVSFEEGDTRRTFFVNDNGRVVPTNLPQGIEMVGAYHGQVIVHNSSAKNWVARNATVTSGSIASMPRSEIGKVLPNVHLIFQPQPRESLMGIDVAITSAGVLVSIYRNVRARVTLFDFDQGQWHRQEIGFPDHGAIGLVASDPSSSVAFMSYQSFLQPPTLYAVDAATGEARRLWGAPAVFDASGLVTDQYEAVSKDGTRVPYFLVRGNAREATGRTPTLLWGYGAVGGTRTPHYDGALGRLWLSEGGAYVLANIRGGGEFGPTWHVQRKERRRTYEDFIAVAEDLIRRKVTSPGHLGVRGHSNGGLLVGVTLNTRPELFNAAVLEHPVLDLHLHTLGLDSEDYGAWSKRDERAYLEAQSPLQNLKERDLFPVPLIKSATNDDVLPTQARKYAAKLSAFGLPYYYLESAGGGHALADTPQDAAYYDALVYAYLAERLR